MQPFVVNWAKVNLDILAPLRWPGHPFLFAGFGLTALPPARVLAKTLFRGQHARALFAGLAGHAILPLDSTVRAAFGLMLGHRRTCGRLAVARAAGPSIMRCACGVSARRWAASSCTDAARHRWPNCRPSAPISSTSPPRHLRRIWPKPSHAVLPEAGSFRYGPAVFKLDLGADGAIPWRAAAASAATVHLGGTLDEHRRGRERRLAGRASRAPFVLWRSTACSTRPARRLGKHTVWAYCHVPNGSTVGYDRARSSARSSALPRLPRPILAQRPMTPADLERYNANYIGGDINGGVRTCGSCSRAQPRAWFPIQPRRRVSICAPRPRRRGGGVMACAAITRRRRPCATLTSILDASWIFDPLLRFSFANDQWGCRI